MHFLLYVFVTIYAYIYLGLVCRHSLVVYACVSHSSKNQSGGIYIYIHAYMYMYMYLLLAPMYMYLLLAPTVYIYTRPCAYADVHKYNIRSPAGQEDRRNLI